MIRESEIRDLNYIHHQINEEVQQDTPTIKPLQNSLPESQQIPLQNEQKQINPQAASFGHLNSMNYKQQPFRKRKSTFQKQYEEQAAVEFAAAVDTIRDFEEEEYENNNYSKGSRQCINSCTILEEKISFSSRCWKNINRYFIVLINFFANKNQKFIEKEREEKFIQVKLESTYESFISVQWCLAFSYLALFIIDILKNQFSNTHHVSSTSPNQQSSLIKNQNEQYLDYSLSEVIIQLTISLINFGLIYFSKSNKLYVRGILIIIQLAEIVYLQKLLFCDFGNYFQESLNSQDEQNIYQKQQQQQIMEGNNNQNTYINSWDIYVELRYELLKSLFLMITCFLLLKNMIGWNYRFLFSSILICIFTILLFNKNSFWLFITSLVILTILFNIYFYYEEKRNRQTFIDLQSYQDKNSPSLYNMIHEQISSGLIVVTRSMSDTNSQKSNNQYLQLKFANKISFEQLECNDENEILQKFREISVKSELAASKKDLESEKNSTENENEYKENNNIEIAEDNSKTQQNNKLKDHMGQTQTLYDKLVCYIDEIYKIKEQQNNKMNIHDNVVSMNLISKQPSNQKPLSNISKFKGQRSSIKLKKTNSMIQLGKSETFRKLKQHSSTLINKARSQTPRNSTFIKANIGSNRIISNNRQATSEYSIQKINSLATPNFSDLHIKINQFSGSKLDQKRNESKTNSEIKFKRKGSFINMKSLANQFSPQNQTYNFSPVKIKSHHNGIEEGTINSQNKGSNLGLKESFYQVSEQKNLNSPSIYNISPKKGQEKRPEKSSFGQLIYGVMKSSTQDNLQLRQSAQDSVDTPAKDSLTNKKINNINNFASQTNQQKSHLNQNQKKKYSDNNESDYEENIQIDEEEEENSNEKGQFSRSMIQVQIPSNEMHYQQFDFKINQIEWDNVPALIILVTDSTQKLMNEKLKELDVYKEELLHTMQHISRTPLNSIINISEILLNEYFKQYKMTNSTNLFNNIAINTGSVIQNNQMIGNQQFNQNQSNNQFNNNLNNNINTVNPKFFQLGTTNSIINVYNGTAGDNINNIPTLNQHQSNNFPENFQSNNSNFNNMKSSPNILMNNNDNNNINEFNSDNVSPQKQENNPLAIQQERFFNELETVVQNLHIIKNNGLILLHTINTVTDLSMFQTNQGQLYIDPVEFSLQNIIEEIQDLYLHQIQEKKLQFSIQIPQNLERINSDKKRIVQVLFEIIGNAIKYTNNGSIQIKIKEQEKGVIWVKIQDSGQGMSESLKHSLFSNKLIQYYNRERDFSRKNSAGLGLDFSRKIVGILGPFYQIFIKSAEGAGSCFKFLLYTDYNERQKIDIPQLRERIMMLQNQGNDQAGGIFTPDITGHQQSKQQDNKNYNQPANGNQQNINNQILIKKGSNHQQQSMVQLALKRNSQSNPQQNKVNSKIYNSCGIGVFNGQNPHVAVSDVAEVDELISSLHMQQMNIQDKKDNNQDQINYFSGSIIDKEQKSNISTLKQSNLQLQKQKYFPLNYYQDEIYRFPLSANYNQISHHDLDLAQSSMIGGSKSKKMKKQSYKNQVFYQQNKIPAPLMIDFKMQNSEQMIPCIEIDEDVQQRYNQAEIENENFKNNVIKNKYDNTQDSQNKSHEVVTNNISTQNQYSNNIEKTKSKQQSSLNDQTKTNINQNKDNQNIKKLQINLQTQNIQQKLNSLNNSQNLSDDSVTTAGGGQYVIEQSGIIPKRVYNSSSTHPNNLKNLGPSIFMKPNSNTTNHHSSFYLNSPPHYHNINENFPSHQRIEMNQVLNKNDVKEDADNQEPLPEQSFVDNVSPEIQIKQESLYMDQISTSQKFGKNNISIKTPQVSQFQFNISSQPNSPLKKMKLERQETKNTSMIYQTLKIDDYDQMLSLTFPEKSYVLGVDDNIFNLTILEMVFKKCSNVIFHRAGNGQECLQKAQELKQTQNAYYKLFLMDIQMPIMDGYKAHQELKKLMKKKAIEYSPVIAVTAYANEKQICMKQGMEGFIEKPINMKVLITIIYDYFIKNKNNQKQNLNC